MDNVRNTVEESTKEETVEYDFVKICRRCVDTIRKMNEQELLEIAKILKVKLS